MRPSSSSISNSSVARQDDPQPRELSQTFTEQDMVSAEDVSALFRRNFGDPQQGGWRVRLCDRFGYHTPEKWYQAIVDKLVNDECVWIDVGGGKSIFPHNATLSSELANRAKRLVGVDPSENINANTFVDERAQSTIEEFKTDTQFSLATLRMVAEHVEHPDRVSQSLCALIQPYGFVVIYTPNRWSLSSLAASIVPNAVHPFLVRFITPNRESEDVFPTRYRMNTRRQLKQCLEAEGFREVAFRYVDDCSLFRRFYLSYYTSLLCWKITELLNCRFPDNNLLGVYQRVAEDDKTLNSRTKQRSS